jgi:3-isopropylmalate dehydrogenase
MNQRTHRIAVLPGDGIGPEVIAEGIKALRAVESKLAGASFELQEFSVGAGEYLKSGDPLPEDTFDRLKAFDTILLGAMGLPDVRWPGGVEMTPQLDLRERLDLYCGLRPIRLYHADDSPLKSAAAGEIDLLIVRESTEGLFSSRKNGADHGLPEAGDTMRITREGSERLFRAAFAEARKRRGRCTLVDKANVLPSMAYFRGIFDEVSREFPDVATERIYVDAAALYLVQRPHSFDVMVTENMFGDILSDLAAGLVGGMGMAPSADIGDEFAVFQPSHGSAPDIAGRGVANPAAAILSVKMMLEWFDDEETRRGAAMIDRAVARVFGDPANRARLERRSVNRANGRSDRPRDHGRRGMKDGYRIFDTHTHIGYGLHHGRRYSADRLLAAMDGFGVDRSLAIPFPVVEDFREAHDEIGRAVKAHPDRIAGAACIYPYVGRDEYRDEVKRCVEELGFRALKLQPQYQPLDPLLERGDFLYETALEFKLPVVVHTGTGAPFSLPSLYILPARRFPELKIVLAHCGGGGLFFAEAVVAATVCPNIYLELSTLMPHHILQVLRHIPASRLMIGSDLPESLATELSKILSLDESPEVKRDILWTTGCNVFGDAC